MATNDLHDHKPDADFWRSATGRVVSSATDKPVEGADIRFFLPDAVRFVTVKSGPDGTWRANDLVPGTYNIEARHPDYVWQTYRPRICEANRASRW